MTELSPAAQAVRSAYHEICEDYIETWLSFNHNRGLAAVLRTLADTKATEVSVDSHYRMIVDVDDIHAIAEELEAQ
jgi:hypothetical protein